MRLAIFDMDGTLYNTNDVNYFAYKESLEKYNISIDYEYYCNYCNGRHYSVFIPPLVNGDKDKIKDIHETKKNVYSKYLDKVKINEQLFNIIIDMKANYKIALVTTASKKNTMEILKYTNKLDLFDLILTADDIKKPKPDPEGFLLAINKFEVKPKDCIIFEDSDVGIEAAKKTNASVLRIESF